MTVRLFAMTCGWLTMPMTNFLVGEEGDIRLPVPAFLIDHPKGQVLFDTGLHTDLLNPIDRRAQVITKHFNPEFKAGEELAARLEFCDVDVTKVRYLINSHLHFDHAGGNHQVPNAQLIVQKREWLAGHDPDLMQSNGFALADYDHGHDLNLVDGEHDLFGDGSVVCLPTYGHTPGHQSLKVRLGSGDVLLAGDACYLRQTLENLHLPKIVHSKEEMLESLHRIRALQTAGARIFYGHDADFWKTVPQAPAEVV
ncbi:MAG: N-acyl homoserine lactonase family protein [Rhodospirillaceae bacterium]|jgi:glyoxylase-like metal-dependent hydrolase (beta-lactamase superfamily II)|nr:N-acyl homoserine lactonase family protein [Rhodospirillaceae bacterium]MBT4688030.1 N-acyl homoserine lactonase family protein [Rhodospirillaceae bacterium]MBT5083320.1 N-acyl homoserine lactonase family protein [Rhodospirillaceae bacterium]MBT5526212.1 N-acyl homoserine lactonase family protein [Rhodospirillaceae bacterium]MBT5882294.1 N-acyl homoserine lactonase family protein [Rhodospirillaceae bacterium]